MYRISKRIAISKLKFRKNKTLSICKIYAPTAEAKEIDRVMFFEILSEVLKQEKQNRTNQILILGDFNSQVGNQE